MVLRQAAPRGRGAFLKFLLQYRQDGRGNSVRAAAAAWEGLSDAARSAFERQAGEDANPPHEPSAPPSRGGGNGFHAFLSQRRAARDASTSGDLSAWRRQVTAEWRQLSPEHKAAWGDKAKTAQFRPRQAGGGSSPYVVFAKEVGPTLHGNDVAAQIAAQWRRLPDHEKEYYRAVASVTPRAVAGATAGDSPVERRGRGGVAYFFQTLRRQDPRVSVAEAARRWRALSAEERQRQRASALAAAAQKTPALVPRPRALRPATPLSVFLRSRPAGEPRRQSLDAFRQLDAAARAELSAAARATQPASPSRQKASPKSQAGTFVAFAALPRNRTVARGVGRAQRLKVLTEHFSRLSPDEMAAVAQSTHRDADVSPSTPRPVGRPPGRAKARPAARGAGSPFTKFVSELAKERKGAPPRAEGFLRYAAKRYAEHKARITQQ